MVLRLAMLLPARTKKAGLGDVREGACLRCFEPRCDMAWEMVRQLMTQLANDFPHRDKFLIASQENASAVPALRRLARRIRRPHRPLQLAARGRSAAQRDSVRRGWPARHRALLDAAAQRNDRSDVVAVLTAARTAASRSAAAPQMRDVCVTSPPRVCVCRAARRRRRCCAREPLPRRDASASCSTRAMTRAAAARAPRPRRRPTGAPQHAIEVPMPAAR